MSRNRLDWCGDGGDGSTYETLHEADRFPRARSYNGSRHKRSQHDERSVRSSLVIGDTIILRLSAFKAERQEHANHPARVTGIWHSDGRPVAMESFVYSTQKRASYFPTDLLCPLHSEPSDITKSRLTMASLYLSGMERLEAFRPKPSKGNIARVPDYLWADIAARRVAGLLFSMAASCMISYSAQEQIKQAGLIRDGFTFPLSPRRQGHWFADAGQDAYAPAVTGLAPQHVENIVRYVYALSKVMRPLSLPPSTQWPEWVLDGWVHAPRAGQQPGIAATPDMNL